MFRVTAEGQRPTSRMGSTSSSESSAMAPWPRQARARHRSRLAYDDRKCLKWGVNMTFSLHKGSSVTSTWDWLQIRRSSWVQHNLQYFCIVLSIPSIVKHRLHVCLGVRQPVRSLPDLLRARVDWPDSGPESRVLSKWGRGSRITLVK